MMICKDCKGTSMKSRRNFTHGSKSKSTTTYTCKKCGSTNIDVQKNGRRGRR